jgi:nucleoside-diphosphate-sugar epimerase
MITGASGFIGRALLERVTGTRRVIAAARRTPSSRPGLEWVACADLARGWQGPFPRVDTLVHLAAIAHAPAGAAEAPRIMEVNGHAPVELARQAAAAGVRRIVFLSSVKALGERSERPLRPDDPPAPGDAYGEAKRCAESGLRRLHEQGLIEVVIVRCPLVYGPGVKGNFAALLRLARSGLPLPFGAVHNRRSLVSTWNLADFLVRAADAPAACGRVLHVADERSLSTAELVRLLAAADGRAVRLVGVPPGLVRAVLSILGRGGAARRLLDSLELDCVESQALLAWRAPLSIEEGLRRTVSAGP